MSIVDEMNEILAETGEPPTTLEELERSGIAVIPVTCDEAATEVEVA